jgi:phosphatidate phosphatase APP1
VSIRATLQTLDEQVARGQRALGTFFGRRRRLRALPYRGWVTRDKAVILGRVLDDDVAIHERLGSAPRLLRVTYERFATVPAPSVPVRVTYGGQRHAATSDGGGFIDLSVPLSGAAGLDHATLALEAPDAPDATAELFPLDPHAAIGFISDIDDTVLETDLVNPIRRGLQLVYSEQRMRLPFEGIAALYQAFVASGSPAFYVSNAPWNLYPHVAELLDHNAIPKGPLLLRDQRLVERRAAGGRAHKQVALRRLVEDHPQLTFVLLGDSSRKDPLRYVEVAEQHPQRVAAIYIRRVRGWLASRGADLAALGERARRAGVELVVADDTVTIARHAASRGFIVGSEVGHVKEGQREDAAAPPPEAAILGS